MEALINPSLSYANEAYTLGQRAYDHRGFEYMFIRVSSSFGVHPGLSVAIDESYEGLRAVPASAHVGDRLGVAMSVLDGDPGQDQYGWVSIYGVGEVDARPNTAAHTHLYTGAGGRVGDVTTSQERLHNIYLTTANGGSNALTPAVWYYPRY